MCRLSVHVVAVAVMGAIADVVISVRTCKVAVGVDAVILCAVVCVVCAPPPFNTASNVASLKILLREMVETAPSVDALCGVMTRTPLFVADAFKNTCRRRPGH